MTEEQVEQEERLATVVGELLRQPEQRAGLADHLASYARPDAAEKLAMLLLDIAKK